MRAAVLVLWLLGVSLGCGAEGTAAPFVPGPQDPSSCVSADEALDRTTGALTGEGRAESRAMMRRVLGDLRGIKVILQATIALLHDTDQSTFAAVHALPATEGTGALGTHLVEVLHYMDGSGRYSAPHREPLGALHAMAERCQAANTWAAVGGLLALDVKPGVEGALEVAPYGAGVRSWLEAVVDTTQQALDQPELRQALERVALDDAEAPTQDPNGTIRVGRDAFQLLFHLVAANLAAPDFDPAATRQLVDDALLTLVDDAVAREATARMLDVLFLPMDPNAAVFHHMQAFMACVDDADEARAIPGMLFDWLTVPELSPGAFVDDVASQTHSDAAGALRPVAVRLLAALAARPSLAADTARVAGNFLDADNGPALVRTLIFLKGRGVMAELLGFLDELETCR